MFDAKGCVACHSTDGSPRVGPTMKGYLGATLILEDGTQVIGSEARFLASLDKPEPLRNYPPSMPGYGDNLGARERQAMMIYVQSLR